MPDKSIQPEVETLAEEGIDKYDIYKIDVDKSYDLANDCQVNCMPTF